MHIYYINLARRPERRTFMEEQFARLGLSAIRIEATTPDDLTEGQREQVRRLERGEQELGGYCCTLSHLAAMRLFLAGGDAHALILEDDAVLSPSLPLFLAAFEASPPEGVDLLRIETARRSIRLKPAGEPLAGFALCRSFSWEAGRAGYIVSRPGARTVLSSREVLLTPHDQAMFDPYEPLARRIAVRQLDPALCIQAHMLSRDGPTAFPSDLGYKRGIGRKQSFARRVQIAFRREIVVGSQKVWHQFVGGAVRRPVPFKSD